MKITTTNHNLADAFKGRMVYLLAMVIIVQTIYPITANNSYQSLIIYNVLGLTFIVVGILIAHRKPTDTYALMVGRFPKYALAGHMTAEELLVEDRLGSLGYGATYIAKQNELKK